MNPNQESAGDVAYFRTSGALLHAAKHWISVVENFPYGLGALIFNYVLYQSEVVPRWISIWGLAGAILLLAMGLLRLYGYDVTYLAIPIVLNEIVLSIWLIAIGIHSFATGSALVGGLFIAALLSSMLSGVFLKSVEDAEYLAKAAANEKQVLVGALLLLVLTASVITIPIVMFPILQEYSVGLALAYMASRILEGISDAGMAISQLLLLTLSREFAKTRTPAAEATVD